MKSLASADRIRTALTGGAVVISLAVLPACKPAAHPTAPAAKPAAAATAVKTNAPVARPYDSEQFASVFIDVLPPEKAKDPFYPGSTRRLKVVKPETSPQVAVHVEPVLVLKGTIKGHLAVINGSTLELGEERGVRVPNGRITVKLLEIGDDYVMVQVGGEPEKKKLMLEHKKSYHETH